MNKTNPRMSKMRRATIAARWVFTATGVTAISIGIYALVTAEWMSAIVLLGNGMVQILLAQLILKEFATTTWWE